jgi:vanillate O-demethylase ferredoxin subunit
MDRIAMSADIDTSAWLEVVVRRVAPAGGGVLVIDLAHPTGAALPPFTPGAHVALRCGPDIVRHYSLCGPADAPAIYRLGVKVEPESRGGSAWVRDNVAPGARAVISLPRNNFPLATGRADYLFVSGGIGITPILPMLEALRASGQRARLVHLCRSPGEMAFEDVLRDIASFHDVHLHFDSVAGAFFDVEGELDRTRAQTEVYCCGPTPLMDLVHAYAARHARVERYHFEFFNASPEPDAARSQFVVVLASTGREIPVGADESILSALRDAGLSLESECEEGVCGTCAVRVLAGTPEHRDHYLTDAERAANDVILPCISRSQSASLTLDL